MFETTLRGAPRHVRLPVPLLPIAVILLTALSAGEVFAQSTTTEESAANKAQYESLAAMYDAKTKMYEAEAAANKAKFGDVKSLFEGNVTPGEGAGNAEAQLLATRAYKGLAANMADKIDAALDAIVEAEKTNKQNAIGVPAKPAGNNNVGGAQTKNTAPAGAVAKDVMLLTVAPDFNAVVVFEARSFGFDEVYKNLPKLPDKVELASVAGVLAGAQAVNALLGVVRTDFSVRGASVTGSEHAWTIALAGALKAKGVTVRMPGLFSPKLVEHLAREHLDKLLRLLASASVAIKGYDEVIDPLNKQLEKLEKELASTKSASHKKKIENDIENLNTNKKKPAAERQKWVVFQTALSAYVVELTSPDKDGRIALADIARQGVLRDQLGLSPTVSGVTSRLLLTKLEHTVGSSYVKKNLFTSFGGMPFYVMGGASASAILFNMDGTVALAESLPWHGGFYKASEVENAVNPPQGQK